MAEDLLELPEETEQQSTEPEQDETALPLGTYAPFDISDKKEWTKADLDKVEGGALRLAENGRAMVEAAAKRESLARRLEVSRAWDLELKDRGFYRNIPTKGGGWEIYGQNANLGIYGSSAASSWYDLPILSVHNDIIVNALARDMPKTEFDQKDDSDEAITTAAEANKIKLIIAALAGYEEALRKIARTFCTDERAVAYIRPVADGQTFGFEEDDDAVPEADNAAPEQKPHRKPNIRPVLSIHGKLSHKCQIACDDDAQSPYQIIADEYDTAGERATFPWIAQQIEGGGAGIAEIELDRVARASAKVALMGPYSTGQANTEQTTRLMCWLTPKMYYDDSCEAGARDWFLENFPNGSLWVYAGTELAFCRWEAWQEVLVPMHARTGKGQNRRSLTEAYAGANMVLNNLFDLMVKFFTSTVPRTFYDAAVFNVPQLRNSGNIPGRKEPFAANKVTPNVAPILNDPMPTHQPALPDTITWLSGPMAQLLTGAQLTLQGAQNEEGEQGTLGEAKMDNDSAMTRLSEPWGSICRGFSDVTLKAVRWMARVAPEEVFDRTVKDEGRIRAEMTKINADLLVVTDTNTNFPESWTEREERVWQLIQEMPKNPFVAGIMMSPANATVIKDAARMGLTIPGAASWEKQEGEFAILLNGQPQKNPKIAEIDIQIQKLKVEMEKGADDVKQRQVTGQPIDPKEVQMLEQGLQAIQQLTQQKQQLPPLVSTVQVRDDGSQENAIEAACCLERMISPEGRRLANSANVREKLAFANLHLHWAEEMAAAKKTAAQNQKPVEPEARVTLAVDKMPGAVQAELLSKIGIAADPASFDEMGPHEVTHEVEGVNESGAKEKVTTSLVGKKLD